MLCHAVCSPNPVCPRSDARRNESGEQIPSPKMSWNLSMLPEINHPISLELDTPVLPVPSPPKPAIARQPAIYQRRALEGNSLKPMADVKRTATRYCLGRLTRKGRSVCRPGGVMGRRGIIIPIFSTKLRCRYGTSSFMGHCVPTTTQANHGLGMRSRE